MTLGTLEAAARIPSSHRAGFIGWALYFQEHNSDTIIIIARGNDLDRRGFCHFVGEGLWRRGLYSLHATRFHPTNLVPLRSSHRKWVLHEPAQRIGCGTITDPLPALYL